MGLVAAVGALVIGLTRIALGMHSWVEVMAGGVIGVAGALVLARVAGRRPDGLRLRWVVAGAVVVVASLHGLRLPAEAHIRVASFDTARWMGLCRGARR